MRMLLNYLDTGKKSENNIITPVIFLCETSIYPSCEIMFIIPSIFVAFFVIYSAYIIY